MTDRDSPSRPAGDRVGAASVPRRPGPAPAQLAVAPAAPGRPGGPAWLLAGLAAGALLALAWSSRRPARRGPGSPGPALDRYRLLAEHARDIALFIAPDGRIVEANRAAEAAYGYSREALLSLRIADLRDPSGAADLPDQMARADADGLTFEAVHRRADGSSFPVEVSSRGAEVDGRRLLLSLVRDIGDRRRAERATRDADRRYRALVDGVLQLVWVNDPAGRTTFVNRRWSEYAGRDPEALLDLAWFDLVPPEDLARLQSVRDEAIRAGRPYESEFRLRRLDGELRWHMGRTVPLLDPEGRVECWFGTGTDIHDRVLAERALTAARDAAEEATRSRDRFMAVLSHELRNPLMPVLVSASALLEDPETPPAVRPTLELTRRNVELEARLIDDLLDVSRIAQGKLRLDRHPLDAHELVGQAVEICRDEVAAKGVRLDLDLAAGSHHVDADPARLQQVLWNLIKNAAKFTPEGGSVSVRSRSGGGRLAVEVADTGIGIDPEILPRVFDAFEQGDPAVTRRFGGLGLGLAISRSLAEAHGGTLDAASEGPGRGSTFTLTLPAVDAPPRPAPGRSRDPGEAGPATPPLRILLVEDNQDSLRVMARLLGLHGHRVAAAASLGEALEAANGDVFDLVISDIGLPDGSGLDLMRQLRPRVALGGIALSGFGMEDDLRKSDQAGFVAHLTKPVDFARLESTIREVALRSGIDEPG